jgi:hypothetical protein
VTKCAQDAAAKALEAANKVNIQHDYLRELIIKLQRSCKRSHSRYSSAESLAVPDLVTDHQLLNADCLENTPAHENGEPIGSSVVTPSWIARARLQHERAWMAQHIGHLYKANTDPAALLEAVA